MSLTARRGARSGVESAPDSFRYASTAAFARAAKQSLRVLHSIDVVLTNLTNNTHTEQLPNVGAHHTDPFDRMLIAQAEVEGEVSLVTHDRQFEPYDVAIVWV